MGGFRTQLTARTHTHTQELRPMPDLSEARSSWEKAKAEHKRARLRALERDKKRQAVEVLKQQVVRKRYQGIYGQGDTRRVKQEGVLQLPCPPPSEKGHDQRRCRNPSHSPLRLICSTPIAETSEVEWGEGGKEKRDHTDNDGDDHATAVIPRFNPSLFHAIIATSSLAPSTNPRQTPTQTAHIAASSFSFTSCSRALDMYRSPNKRQYCSASSPSTSSLRDGHRTSCPRSSTLPSKHTKIKGSNSLGSTATPMPQVIPPPRPPPTSCQLLSHSPWENADESWGRALRSLYLGGNLYTDVSHDVASLLHDHGARVGGRDEQKDDSSDEVLRRWSSCDSPTTTTTSSSSSSSNSSSGSSGANLGRSWEEKLVQEEDVLLARFLNSGEDEEGVSQGKEKEEKH